MKKTAVFIVDDHYMVIEGIRTLLEDESGLELIGHASNAGSCLAFLQNKLPDVILMDISLPDRSGMDLCADVRQQFPSVFVIGLSTFNQYSYIDAMMQHGASGYLLKNASKSEIIEAIHAAATGKTYFSDAAAQSLKSGVAENIPLITRREKEVLKLIAEGFTNLEIASQLFLSLNTVDTHRKSIMRKLNVKNTALLIRYAVEQKWV